MQGGCMDAIQYIKLCDSQFEMQKKDILYNHMFAKWRENRTMKG